MRGYMTVWCSWIRVAAIAACIWLGPVLIAEASVPDRETISDARCVLAGMHVAFLGSPQERAGGLMIAMYYFGRLDERSQHQDTERLIEAEARNMTPEQYRADAARCGKALGVKGRELQRIGADLSGGARGGMPGK